MPPSSRESLDLLTATYGSDTDSNSQSMKTDGLVRDDIVQFLCNFLLEQFPTDHLLNHFVPASTLSWRKTELLSPTVSEFLHVLTENKETPISSLQEILSKMLLSTSIAEVCCFFWVYITSSGDPLIPRHLYQRFVTPATLISHDVICGVLRSVLRRLPPSNATIFRAISRFGYQLLQDSEKASREHLSRVFSPAFTGRRSMEEPSLAKQKTAEEISCQWLFVYAPRILDLDSKDSSQVTPRSRLRQSASDQAIKPESTD